MTMHHGSNSTALVAHQSVAEPYSQTLPLSRQPHSRWQPGVTCRPKMAISATEAATAIPASGRIARAGADTGAATSSSIGLSSISAAIRSSSRSMPCTFLSPRKARPISRYSAALRRSSASWLILRSKRSASASGNSPSTKAEICILIASFILHPPGLPRPHTTWSTDRPFLRSHLVP